MCSCSLVTVLTIIHSWTSRIYYSQLRLDPLSAESAHELAHVILGHDASVIPLARRLIELTEGNPLFLLQIAAVIGKEVPFSLLQTVVELPGEALRQGLAHLQRAEFLYERSLFPELTYTFKHALTHEVAYESLRQEQRSALHARIIGAIEALDADRLAEQVERLAYHALRGEVWVKALAYCRQAGEKAMTRSAHREAVAYFERALSALPRLPE